MAENPSPPKPPFGHMPIQPRKVFVRPDQPLFFINATEFTGVGMDVFMDVGVITAESAAAAAAIYKEHPEAPAPADFQVSFRFGMTIQAAVIMHQRLTQLLQVTQTQQSQQLAALAENEKDKGEVIE
jgi:hypothetical protein